MKLRDLYKLKPTQGATSNGWHQIEPLLRCYMEYKLSRVIGARTPLVGTPDPLAKGSLFHVGRAGWYNRKFKTDAKTINQIRNDMLIAKEQASPGYSQRAMDDAWSYIQQYIEHWSVRPLPTPVGVEYDLGPIPVKPDAPWWLDRTARLDDVSKYPEAPNGALCIGECKTTSVGVDDVENEYTLHGQLLMQMLLWRLAPQGERKHGPITHIMVDAVKKGYGTEKCTFARIPMHITLTSLHWFVQSMEYHLTQAMRIGPDTWVPRNPKQCTRQIGRMRVPCDFRDLCKFGDSAASKYVNHEGVSLATLYKDKETKPWD